MRALISILTLALSLTLTGAVKAETAGAGVRRFALVVGANDGGASRVRLSYATSDAQAFAGVMSELGGVATADLILLLNPTRADIEAGFVDLGERVTLAQAEGHARTEVIFYYSGHSDEQGLRLGEELLPYSDLKAELSDVGSDVRLAVLDSCASGALTRVKGGSFQAPFLVDDANKVKGYAILTSSSADEAAQESDRLQASFFTHSLVSGLRGAADTTGDSRVTLNEVYNFAFNDTLARTEKTNAGAQHPAYDIQLAGTGDLILTDLRQTSAILTLADSLDGRIFVRDAAGHLVLEVRKVGGQKMDLALEPGTYTITVQLDSELRQGDVLLRDGDREPLDVARLASVTPEEVALRGDVTVNVNITNNHYDGSQAPQPPPPGPAPCPPASRAQLNVFNVAKAIDGTQVALLGNRVGCDLRGFQAAIGLNTVGRDVDGVQVAVGPNVVTGDVTGLQATASMNFTRGTVEGIQGSAGFNVAMGAAKGLQAAAGFNVAGTGQSHAQGAGGFNVAVGDIAGGQGTAGFNVTMGALRGLQAAGGFNVTGRDLRGFQGAAGFNVTGGDLKGFQGAGGFNVVGGDLDGVQASAGFSWAGSVDGLQISVINISGHVEGAQVGIVNIAKDVKGTQVGLVNIARDVDGFPIGLLNVVKEGEHRFSVWGDDLGHVNGAFLLGARNVYTQFSAGMNPRVEGRYTFGLGLGLHFVTGRWWIDPVVSAQQIYDASVGWEATNMLNQAELLIGRQVLNHFAVYAGPSFNVHVTTGDAMKLDLTSLPSFCQCGFDSDVRVRMWPGFVLGVRI